MKRPCPVALTGCPGVDAPITNISAEAPDPLLFAGIVWDIYDPYKPPVLGNGQTVDIDCGGLSSLFAQFSPVIYAETQLQANLQALAAELGCSWPPSGDQTFINDERTATVVCPDGSTFTYTVAAGTLTSPLIDAELGAAWVTWANAWADAYAFQQASALMDCITRPDPPDGPGPVRPPGTGTPLMDVPFYWCCLGQELDPSANTYTIGGRADASYTIEIISGSIPPGTTFEQTGPRSCTLSGTPTAAGAYVWEFRATSTTIPTLTISVVDNLFVFGLTNAALPDAQEGTAYGPQQLTADGGTPPYTFISGDLPVGFSMTSAGVLTSDTSTSAGDYVFTVTITDANGGFCDQEVPITVTAPACPDWTSLIWPVPNLPTSGAGTASFTPNNTTGDSFAGAADAPNKPPDSAVFQVAGSGARILNYAGPACNCNLHIVLSKLAGTEVGNILVAYGPTFITLLFWDFGTHASGTYDVPFSVPDSGGVPYNIRVTIQAQTIGVGHLNITAAGTFSNI